MRRSRRPQVEMVSSPKAPRKMPSWPHGKVKLNVFPRLSIFLCLCIQPDLARSSFTTLGAERTPYTTGSEVINRSSFSLRSDCLGESPA